MQSKSWLSVYCDVCFQDLCNGIYIARIQHLLGTEYKLYYQAWKTWKIFHFELWPAQGMRYIRLTVQPNQWSRFSRHLSNFGYAEEKDLFSMCYCSKKSCTTSDAQAKNLVNHRNFQLPVPQLLRFLRSFWLPSTVRVWLPWFPLPGPSVDVHLTEPWAAAECHWQLLWPQLGRPGHRAKRWEWIWKKNNKKEPNWASFKKWSF